MLEVKLDPLPPPWGGPACVASGATVIAPRPPPWGRVRERGYGLADFPLQLDTKMLWRNVAAGPVSNPLLQQKRGAADEVAVPFAVEEEAHHEVWKLAAGSLGEVGLILAGPVYDDGAAMGETG